MSRAIATTSPTRKPRPRRPERVALADLRPPSQRDLEIYKQVQVLRVEQFVVAHHFRLHASRVCQIVGKVRRWLAAGGAASDPAVRDFAARQRLARAALKLRLERAVQIAQQAVEGRYPPHRTTWRRYQGGAEIWREEVERPHPDINLPGLRLLLKSIEALRQFEELEELDPAQAPPTEQDLLHSVFDLLCRWRVQAEAEGRMPASQNAGATVAEALAGLLGPTATALDPALKEASRSAKEALNFSAAPESTDAANGAAATSCGESSGDMVEKKVQK